MALLASSYIPTVATTVTRNGDSLNFPFNAEPQAMTLYLRFIENGSAVDTADDFLLTVGGAATPRLLLDNVAGYRIGHQTSGGLVTSTVVAATLGQGVELLATLSATGSVQISSSINGGAVTVAAASATLTLAQAWAAPQLWFGNGGAVQGSELWRNLIIARGIQTMATMRRLAAVA